MSDKNTDVDWKKMQEKINEAKSNILAKEKSSREEIINILRKRAENFAKHDDKHLKELETISVLEFVLGQEKYAIKTENLKEIIASDSITEVPCTPSFIYGIINIRGKIVSVIDLKKYLHLDYIGITDKTSIVVAIHNEELIGIIVDQINGIRNIDTKEIQKTKFKLKTIKESYISGITNETVIILDIDKVLSDNAIHVNDTIT